MQTSKFYELGERIARLMESYGLEVSDLEDINGLIEKAAKSSRVRPVPNLDSFSSVTVWPAGTEKYSNGPFFL